MGEVELPSDLPQEPAPPAHKVRRQSRVRRSVRVFLQRRGISLRRRRQRERLSVPLTVMAVLALAAVVVTWGWFRDVEMPWLDMGRCRLAFPLVVVLALVAGVLFVINVLDLLAARRREEEREAEKREEE